MDKEYLHKHFGEQVDFDKVEEGWNDKASGEWVPKSQMWNIPALKLALNGLRSTTTNVEVVIVSHGSVLRELTNGRGDWRSGEVRSYLIDDNGKPFLFLDKGGLEIHSQPTGPSILAKTLTHKPSESSEKAHAVKMKVVIQIVAKDTSKNTKEEILKVLKRCETDVDALFKIFQEELQPTKVEGGDIEGVKARPIIVLKQGPITKQPMRYQ
ncbi:putative phosphoglycerate mutase family protein [Botrytis fragariae]|uniref:Putative phosphoglycerate mutase family protein n=1 Tax=Botrytis fragariae TaxID=1964551 RepID=A0A8H6EJP7_9HELO|nr:putative phosphoglycerate mutase family protein [Botrytis fragariae]KAF5874380.1 putative phosphoglycerate mutase family protein [Botrytis fragariae]